MRYEISDELREWAARHTPVKLGTQLACGPVEQIIAIADRIDREMMERPLAADGKPLVDGETVYDSNGRKYHVNEAYPLVNVSTDTRSCSMSPDRFTHKRPDSFELIADEIEGAKGDCVGNAPLSDIAQDKLHDWADRIRKLAKERRDE